MALRRFLRSFDLGFTLGDDLGTKVDVAGSLFTAVSVTQIEVYGSGRGFPGGKASSVMALRRFLRSFDLGSTLGDDLGMKVDVYESVDIPLGVGISWLSFTNAARLVAAEGAARSSSDRLTASRTASI